MAQQLTEVSRGSQLNVAKRYRGFTLVELLVVITIIGILISLLLPAVQSAREAARVAQCKNNIKQLALGALAHNNVHGQFPTGGWGWGWMGDPNRGYNRSQPGGWGYNILPYIEQIALHDLGKGQTDAVRRAEGAKMGATPLAVFNCPSRRRATAYPYPHGTNFANVDRPAAAGRSDYAINAGSKNANDEFGPSSLADGDNRDPATIWPRGDQNGISYQRSEVKSSHIRDGLSLTYLIGERYINPDGYETGTLSADDQNLYMGHDRDMFRWGGPNFLPQRDRAQASSDWNFGSAHAGQFYAAMCDGSVRGINYAISGAVHENLANRLDGNVVDVSGM